MSSARRPRSRVCRVLNDSPRHSHVRHRSLSLPPHREQPNARQIRAEATDPLSFRSPRRRPKVRRMRGTPLQTGSLSSTSALHPLPPHPTRRGNHPPTEREVRINTDPIVRESLSLPSGPTAISTAGGAAANRGGTSTPAPVGHGASRGRRTLHGRPSRAVSQYQAKTGLNPISGNPQFASCQTETDHERAIIKLTPRT